MTAYYQATARPYIPSRFRSCCGGRGSAANLALPGDQKFGTRAVPTRVSPLGLLLVWMAGSSVSQPASGPSAHPHLPPPGTYTFFVHVDRLRIVAAVSCQKGSQSPGRARQVRVCLGHQQAGAGELAATREWEPRHAAAKICLPMQTLLEAVAREWSGNKLGPERRGRFNLCPTVFPRSSHSCSQSHLHER